MAGPDIWRPAEPRDVAVIFSLHKLLFQEHIEDLWGWDDAWQRADLEARVNSATWRVLINRGTIVGFVETLREPGLIFIKNLALHPSVQNQGIGTGVLRELQVAAQLEKARIRLNVFPNNEHALRFYGRLGFERIEVSPTFVELEWRPVTTDE